MGGDEYVFSARAEVVLITLRFVGVDQHLTLVGPFLGVSGSAGVPTLGGGAR